MNSIKTLYGKYRGTVTNNLDPMQMGRIQAIVPDVLNNLPTNWAMPCVPIAGNQMGSYFVPHIGASVWIEFEQGDPDYPIWVGGFWSNSSEVPLSAKTGLPDSPNIVLQTAGLNSIVISDLPSSNGGIILKSASGASIIVNDTGIYVQNGKGASVILDGPSVFINNDALIIT